MHLHSGSAVLQSDLLKRARVVDCVRVQLLNELALGTSMC